MKTVNSFTNARAFALACLLLTLTPVIPVRCQDARPAPEQKGIKIGPAGAVRELPAGPKRWALVIGVDQYYKPPDKSYLVINVPKVFKQEEGFDGVVGWTKTSWGVMEMSGWQLAFKKRSTEAGFIYDIKRFKELYPNSSVRGVEKVDGRDTYAVEMTPTVGKPETFYFDKQTGLMIRWDIMYESGWQQGVSVPIQLFAEGYADVNGMLMPMIYRQISPSETSVMRFVDVKFNIPLDETKFRRPGK